MNKVFRTILCLIKKLRKKNWPCIKAKNSIVIIINKD